MHACLPVLADFLTHASQVSVDVTNMSALGGLPSDSILSASPSTFQPLPVPVQSRGFPRPTSRGLIQPNSRVLETTVSHGHVVECTECVPLRAAVAALTDQAARLEAQVALLQARVATLETIPPGCPHAAPTPPQEHQSGTTSASRKRSSSSVSGETMTQSERELQRLRNAVERLLCSDRHHDAAGASAAETQPHSGSTVAASVVGPKRVKTAFALGKRIAQLRAESRSLDGNRSPR